MSKKTIGRYFEELNVGETIDHTLSKTIFESDNNQFCLMTMNHHPVHTNLDYSRSEEYEEPLVVGTLVISIVVGMTVPDISGKAIANLEYNEVKHLAPVFVNDTIYAKSTVLDKRKAESRDGAGIVRVETVASNQNDKDVLRLKRTFLVKLKNKNE